MRHNRTINHLGRQASHRKALMANMAASLILHKRINTTVAKAKALRTFVEPIITKSKDDSTHSRRMVFAYLKNKQAVAELFREVAPKIADRPGGYCRILKPVSVRATAPKPASSSWWTSTANTPRTQGQPRKPLRKGVPVVPAVPRKPLRQPKPPQHRPKLPLRQLPRLRSPKRLKPKPSNAGFLPFRKGFGPVRNRNGKFA